MVTRIDYVYCFIVCVLGELVVSSVEDVVYLEHADAETHDGSLVQLTGHAVGQRQGLSKFAENLRLFAAPATGRIARLFLALL